MTAAQPSHGAAAPTWQAQRSSLKSMRLHLLRLAEARGASEGTKEDLAKLVGETRLSGRSDLLSLAKPIPWLPLPTDFDPLMLAWFDPTQVYVVGVYVSTRL